VTRSMSSFDKAMALFGALVEQDGVFESDAMSVQLGVPESTLYRHLNALHSAGLICRSKRGRYLPNPVFFEEAGGVHTTCCAVGNSTTHFGPTKCRVGNHDPLWHSGERHGYLPREGGI